ncbi:MAG: inositol monophosphatase family protein [Acidimicrobiia bacterium]
MTTVDLHELRDLAMRLASQATSLVMDGLHKTRTSVTTKSSAVDLVTETDKASEKLIVESIRAARPGDGFIGEEGTDIASTTGVRWVIDPIDGTTNFVYGHPGFGVSIAAQLNGHTVVGVVHDCMLGEQFVAVQGEGATRNGQPIWCSSSTKLATSLIATGFSYDARRRVEQATKVASIIGQVRDIRRRGSAALDLCWVACGRVDAYYEAHVNPWDIAAGEIIVREAGGRTAPLDAAHPTGSIVASGPQLFDAFRALLEQTGS